MSTLKKSLLLRLLLIFSLALTPLVNASPISEKAAIFPQFALEGETENSLQKAAAFLAVEQYNSTLKLCQEAPSVAPNTYWLVGDNLLAYLALKNYFPSISDAIYNELLSRDYLESGKHEAILGKNISLPYKGVRTITVESRSDYVIKTEIWDGEPMADWMNYSDLLLYASLSRYYEGRKDESMDLYNSAVAMWDGVGLNDTATKTEGLYATYKLALLLYVTKVLDASLEFQDDIEQRIWAQQKESDGGIKTHYFADGNATGDPNTETTSLALLASIDQSIDHAEINREIKLDGLGRIHVSDSYHIINKVEYTIDNGLTKLKIRLPRGAYDVSAHDGVGGLAVVSDEKNATTYTNATITLRNPLEEKGQVAKFTVTYQLPWESYVDQYGWWDFNLTFTFLERFNWIVRKLTLSLVLPEGAEFESSSVNPDSVKTDMFQQAVTFTLSEVMPFQDLQFAVTYRYFIFWASFRPTLWAGIVVTMTCAIILLWRAPKPPVPTIFVPPDVLRGFLEAYEERERALQELESVEQQARKGKIPRRRYKVRRRALEARLSTISRELTDFRERIQTAGPRYVEIMRRIEVAETELEGLKEDIRRVEVRYRRRELSSEAYRRLLDEYRRRRERAKTAIDGLLLRIREEIR